MPKQKLYTLTYHIEKTPYQRESKQTKKNLTKEDVKDWTKWLDWKLATYKVITQ